jgi:hypothetical protein
VEMSSVAEDDLSHWQAQVPPSTMTIALQTSCLSANFADTQESFHCSFNCFKCRVDLLRKEKRRLQP